jgi:hypothetical protein
VLRAASSASAAAKCSSNVVGSACSTMRDSHVSAHTLRLNRVAISTC